MKKAIYWFRKNLRIHDNPSLNSAIKENDELLFVYIMDYKVFNPINSDTEKIGKFREKFLIESILNLKKDLNKINIKLMILEGNILEIFDDLKKYSSTVYATKEVGTYEEREEKILYDNDFNLNLFEDQNLFESKKLPYQIEELPLIFTHFRKKVEKLVVIRDVEKFDPTIQSKNDYLSPFTIQLEHLMIDTNLNSSYPFVGGENNGLNRLKNYLWKSKNIEKYKETRNGLIGTEYSSKFSAYLCLGCISPVMIYQEVKRYEKEIKKNSSTYWLIFELLWREFFRYVYLKAKSKIFLKEGINGNIFSKNFNNDLKLFEKWKRGETGQEFIDANMKELKETGFMSNRGRQNVASYLINNLDLNWVWGASFFEKHLIDYDVTSNWCNWMYVAGVGNNTRNWVFNPERQSELHDKKGIYRSIWLKKKGQLNIDLSLKKY